MGCQRHSLIFVTSCCKNKNTNRYFAVSLSATKPDKPISSVAADIDALLEELLEEDDSSSPPPKVILHL